MKNNLKFLALAPMAALATTACGPSTENYDIVISAFGTEFLAEGDDWHKELEEQTNLNIKVVHHNENESLEESMETTDFDIIMPSEYMAAKMFDDGKLETIDWDNMWTDKADVEASLDAASKASADEIDLLNYALPYARGDLRVHLNTEYKNGTCKTAVDTAMGGTATDGGDVPVSVLFSSAVNAACDTAILDDDRNVALLTALYDSDLAAEGTDANAINNPLVSDLNASTLKLLSDNSVKLPEEDLSYDFSNGAHGLTLSYNTDPLWIFDYTDSAEFDIMSMNLESASNMWIDTIAMTKGASTAAQSVFRAMYHTMANSSAVYNWYNSPYAEIEADLASEIASEDDGFGEPQESFKLQDARADYYGIIKYDGPAGNINGYNASITKWVEENWGK